MGGAGFVFTGENDAAIMQNSATINLNILEQQRILNEELDVNKTKIFYSGSACMYPEHNQLDPNNPDCRESSAYRQPRLRIWMGKTLLRASLFFLSP